MSGSRIQLIVGLGNPGERYGRTRHNAGAWFVDELARRHGGVFRQERSQQAELARIQVAGAELWLLKPTTFMNDSGASIASVSHFYKLPIDTLLVAHDELDLPVGVVRLKQGGGHGGHNGLRDAITAVGADFWRLRLGIGHPGHKDLVHDYVLQRASSSEESAIHAAIAAAADVLPLLIEQGAEKAMNRLHTRAEN
ncbi:MAG: aminoacyl-tRNA hydrolase [Steroidobacteraceae bacterium]